MPWGQGIGGNPAPRMCFEEQSYQVGAILPRLLPGFALYRQYSFLHVTIGH